MILFRGMTTDEYNNKYMTFKLFYAFHCHRVYGTYLIAITNTDEVAYLQFIDKDKKIPFHGEGSMNCTVRTDIDKAVYLEFMNKCKREALEDLKKKWPKTVISKDTENKMENILEIITHPSKSLISTVHVLMKGTEFQIKVWKALTRIPRGKVIIYEDLAKMIHNPKAAIAVGTAISKNYIAVIVPCHRVRSKNGNDYYAWGVDRKLIIRECES